MKKRSIKLLALLMTCTLTVTPMTAFASETPITDINVSESEVYSLDPTGTGNESEKPEEGTGSEEQTAALTLEFKEGMQASKTYDGEAVTISAGEVTVKRNEEEIKEGAVITIYSDEACTTPLEGAITDAGTYYVKAAATIDDKTEESNVLTYTINKADWEGLSIGKKEGADATLDALTYDGSDKKASLDELFEVKGAETGVTFVYSKGNEEVKEVKDAGDYVVAAKVAGDKNHNETDASGTVEFSIKKAEATISFTAESYQSIINKENDVLTNSDGEVTLTYYSNSNCETKVESGALEGGKTYKKTTVTYKASTLKSGKKTFKIGAASKQKGKITYTKTSNAKKTLSVDKKGTVTVKKCLKKGTYTLKVKITAAAKGKYGKTTVTKTIKVKVK